MFTAAERAYLETARVGRLATADEAGRPHAVPICFALVDADGERPRIVSPIDEKPKAAAPNALRRVRDIRANDRVTLLVDHYREDWDRLGWVQVRGTATLRTPEDPGHPIAVETLNAAYDQYETHDLEGRPLLDIEPGSVTSWGTLERPGDADGRAE